MAYTKKLGSDIYTVAKRSGVLMRNVSKYNTQDNINAALQVWWKFDETTGASVADSSGNGKTGTLTNMENSDWMPGRVGGRGILFDNADEYAINTNIGSFGGAVSFAFWFKRNGLPSSANERIFDMAKASATGLQIGLDSSNGQIFLNNSGGPASELRYSTNVCDGMWHHVAVTRTNAAAPVFKLYVDGALQATNSSGSNTLTTLTRLFVGSTSTPDTYFGGYVDDVRIYNRVLSDADVTALYNVTYNPWGAGSGGTETTSGEYKIHTFTSGSSTFTVTKAGVFEVLVVGGGGGSGGVRNSNASAAGGGGGYIEGFLELSANQTITVGAGGAGGAGGGLVGERGSQGGSSSIGTLVVAIGGGGGGGGGGASGQEDGGSGGSGGGSQDATAGGAGTVGQGAAGGSTFGYGGGAGFNGSHASTPGRGVQSSINGTATWRGGGGQKPFTSGSAPLGGGGQGDATDGGGQSTNGAANTGGGGGARWGFGLTGRSGGSGVVIIRYKI